MKRKRGRRVITGAVKPPATIVIPCPHCSQPMRIVNGLWLRSLREARGIGLRQFAAMVGLSSAYISDIERNRRSSTPRIEEEYAALEEEG